jgi:hypothetical protein
MPERSVTVDSVKWRVYPSGYVTQYDGDEFGLMFVSGEGAGRRTRVTRYSPVGTRSREQAFAELTAERLVELFDQSQPGETSPEAHYKS